MKDKDTPYDNDELDTVDNGTDIKQIRAQCLRLLTRREHSQKEIKNKLVIKGYESNQVLAVLEELGQQNWQDDTRYAESYARVRSQKGFGPIRIAYELRQQGVNPGIIDNILTTTTESWMKLLLDVYTKKYPGEVAANHAERGKRIRFLQQRGFSNTMINTLFKQL
ncbi:MAG: regulatory protein RecX [Methyloglobulus sp.]|nr:regulatory protein RecX [Methyloglobulus sp.]